MASQQIAKAISPIRLNLWYARHAVREDEGALPPVLKNDSWYVGNKPDWWRNKAILQTLFPVVGTDVLGWKWTEEDAETFIGTSSEGMLRVESMLKVYAYWLMRWISAVRHLLLADSTEPDQDNVRKCYWEIVRPSAVVLLPHNRKDNSYNILWNLMVRMAPPSETPLSSDDEIENTVFPGTDETAQYSVSVEWNEDVRKQYEALVALPDARDRLPIVLSRSPSRIQPRAMLFSRSLDDAKSKPLTDMNTPKFWNPPLVPDEQKLWVAMWLECANAMSKTLSEEKEEKDRFKFGSTVDLVKLLGLSDNDKLASDLADLGLFYQALFANDAKTSLDVKPMASWDFRNQQQIVQIAKDFDQVFNGSFRRLSKAPYKSGIRSDDFKDGEAHINMKTGVYSVTLNGGNASYKQFMAAMQRMRDNIANNSGNAKLWKLVRIPMMLHVYEALRLAGESQRKNGDDLLSVIQKEAQLQEYRDDAQLQPVLDGFAACVSSEVLWIDAQVSAWLAVIYLNDNSKSLQQNPKQFVEGLAKELQKIDELTDPNNRQVLPSESKRHQPTESAVAEVRPTTTPTTVTSPTTNASSAPAAPGAPVAQAALDSYLIQSRLQEAALRAAWQIVQSSHRSRESKSDRESKQVGRGSSRKSSSKSSNSRYETRKKDRGRQRRRTSRSRSRSRSPTCPTIMGADGRRKRAPCPGTPSNVTFAGPFGLLHAFQHALNPLMPRRDSSILTRLSKVELSSRDLERIVRIVSPEALISSSSSSSRRSSSNKKKKNNEKENELRALHDRIQRRWTQSLRLAAATPPSSTNHAVVATAKDKPSWLDGWRWDSAEWISVLASALERVPDPDDRLHHLRFLVVSSSKPPKSYGPRSRLGKEAHATMVVRRGSRSLSKSKSAAPDQHRPWQLMGFQVDKHVFHLFPAFAV